MKDLLKSATPFTPTLTTRSEAGTRAIYVLPNGLEAMPFILTDTADIFDRYDLHQMGRMAAASRAAFVLVDPVPTPFF
jgi:hypothetical protein